MLSVFGTYNNIFCVGAYLCVAAHPFIIVFVTNVVDSSSLFLPTRRVFFFTKLRCPGPGRSIQGFKFKQAGGRVELIKGIAGGDQNRRKYYSGWCQFIKLAKAFNGYVIKFRKLEHASSLRSLHTIDCH
jgi:hypothetical protein